MSGILWWIFYFLTIYAFLPGLLSRVFGYRVFMRGRAKREIALTFDDGPDPRYTPQLLDLLKRFDAKATFFVVGSKAEQHPDIIKRIVAEGHTLGIHNYVHRSNWIMSPRAVKRQVRRTSDILLEITGRRPVYYRPPWGIVNVFDYAQLRQYRIVLWSAMFKDWKEKVGTDGLYRKMRRKLMPGQVFLLHDSGTTLGADEAAPAHTIEALERILADGSELGLRFVSIDELIGLTERNRRPAAAAAPAETADARPQPGPVKRAVVAAWMLWEKLFHLLFRVRPIGDGSFLHYRIVTYSGRELHLPDGHRLRRGDRVMEMHFDNEKMYEIGMASKSPVHIAIRFIREAEKSLPDLAREFATLPERDDLWGIYGISMINRGGENVGLTMFELPKGPFAVMTNWYLRLLLRMIHPDGGRKLRDHGEKLEPRVMVMPKETLLLWRDAQSSAEVRRLLKQRESVAAAAGRPEAAVCREEEAVEEEAASGAVT